MRWGAARSVLTVLLKTVGMQAAVLQSLMFAWACRPGLEDTERLARVEQSVMLGFGGA